MMKNIALSLDGDDFENHGASILDLGHCLIGIQRLIHKSWCIQDGRWQAGSFPPESIRKQLGLQIGNRSKGSDLYQLIPLITDPTNQQILAGVLPHLKEAIIQYSKMKVREFLGVEKNDEKAQMVSAAYGDMSGIVNRIEASGGINNIKIIINGDKAEFNPNHKKYMSELQQEPVLGPVTSIIGFISKLVPENNIVEIKKGTRRIKIIMNTQQFEEVRYSTNGINKIKVTGRPIYKISPSARSYEEFECLKFEFVSSKHDSI
jgi:hypothetical protein